MRSILCCISLLLLSCGILLADNAYMKLKLPPVAISSGKDSLSAALKERHSCRDFTGQKLSIEQVATILWAAFGKSYDAKTGATRTVPSAGATYPLEVYVLVGKDAVYGLSEGFYHYIADEHMLKQKSEEDIRTALSAACLGQGFISEAPVSIVIAAQFRRTTDRYGQRGTRYVYLDAGHTCQNIYLVAQALGLGTVEVGAFSDDKVKKMLGLDGDVEPLIIMPVGYPD